MINGIEQKFYFKNTDICNMYPQSVPDVLIGLLNLVEHKILLCCRAARSKFCCSFPFSSSSILTEHKYIYKNKVVIYVCQFVCPIITQEPLNVFASNFYKGTRESNGNVLCMVLRFSVRVNGGSNNE